MRIEKYPDFSKKEDKAIVLNEEKKELHTIRVVFGKSHSRVDFEKKRIVISEDLPTEQKKVVLQHEIEHLNEKFITPRWVLSIPGFKFANYFSMEAKARIEREVLNRLLSTLDPKLRLVAITADVFLPQTLDNFIEDFFINKHLVEKHGIDEQLLEDLGGFGTRSSMKFLDELLNAYSRCFGFGGFVKQVEPLSELFSDPCHVGYLVNFVMDYVYCLTEKMKLIDFYDLASRELKREKAVESDIFSKAWHRKVETELERIIQARTILENSTNKLPDFLVFVFNYARSFPEISEIFDFKVKSMFKKSDKKT